MCEPSQQFAYKKLNLSSVSFFFLHRHRRFFYVRIIPDCLSCRLKYMREQQQHRTGTSRSHTPNTVLAPLAQRVCALIPSPHSRMFTSVSVGSILHSYLFTSATTVRIGVHSAPKYGTETIRYVTLLFRYWCGAASLRYRNHAEITVVVCEQKPYPVFAPAQKLSGIP